VCMTAAQDMQKVLIIRAAPPYARATI